MLRKKSDYVIKTLLLFEGLRPSVTGFLTSFLCNPCRNDVVWLNTLNQPLLSQVKSLILTKRLLFLNLIEHHYLLKSQGFISC